MRRHEVSEVIYNHYAVGQDADIEQFVGYHFGDVVGRRIIVSDK